MANYLEQEIQFIKGIGPKKAEILQAEANVFTVGQLLEYYPYRYIDRRVFNRIGQLAPGLTYIQFKGRFTGVQTLGAYPRQRLVATFSDGSGSIELVWFQSIPAIREMIAANTDYVVFGKLNEYGRKISLVHPDFEKLTEFEQDFVGNLAPMYPTTDKMKRAGMNSKAIQRIIKGVLAGLKSEPVPETLPPHVISSCRLCGIRESIETVHFPADEQALQKAQLRIKFEELFYIQLNLLKKKKFNHSQSHGQIFNRVGDYFHTFYKQRLPFELTGAQKRVVKEIRHDTATGKQMNRLVQGDVGSGKTLVALLSMLIALDNGFQACLMAPTEILAQQHYQSICDILGDMPVKVDLLTGSKKAAGRKKLLAELAAGELHIVVGTHALIEDTVVFRNLGLAVIDEQHRFGVAQRAKLWAKNTVPPHILVMTATPIPRTLAMTLYGDLDISVIDELPPGRKPIKTVHYFDSKRLALFGFMREQIRLGRQIYVVYPLIKESEGMDYKDLEDGYESICREFPLPEYSVAVLHGKMKADDKQLSMQHFVSGRSQIMVATTVIEVGVNVPNASVMVIENAERFGLSQLHQLRGRVGRGADQSFCILMTSYKLSEDGKKRIATMVESSDGFVIAEADLRLRGPGDIEGTVQSGQGVSLKMANLARDGQILQLARDIAASIIDSDPLLQHEENLLLARNLSQLFDKSFDWRKIS